MGWLILDHVVRKYILVSGPSVVYNRLLRYQLWYWINFISQSSIPNYGVPRQTLLHLRLEAWSGWREQRAHSAPLITTSPPPLTELWTEFPKSDCAIAVEIFPTVRITGWLASTCFETNFPPSVAAVVSNLKKLETTSPNKKNLSSDCLLLTLIGRASDCLLLMEWVLMLMQRVASVSRNKTFIFKESNN